MAVSPSSTFDGPLALTVMASLAAMVAVALLAEDSSPSPATTASDVIVPPASP